MLINNNLSVLLKLLDVLIRGQNDFEEKVALITGGISGICRNDYITKTRYKVAVNYPSFMSNVAQTFKLKNNIDTIEFDTVLDATKTAFEHMSAKHGHIDILINNMGSQKILFCINVFEE